MINPSPEYLRIVKKHGLDRITPQQRADARADKDIITTAGGATRWLGNKTNRVRRGYGYAPPQTPA